MVRLVIIATLLMPQVSDYEAARRRMQVLLDAIEEVTSCSNPNCNCNPCLCEDRQCGQVVEPLTEPILAVWPFEQPPVKAVAAGNRCYMVTAEWCPPCRRSKNKCGDLIGDPGSGAPVETINVDQRPNYAAEMGLRHARSLPTFITVDASGKETSRRVGEQSRSSLQSILRRYQVNVTTSVAAPDPAVTVATVSTAPSTTAIVAALAEYLARTQEGNEFPVGGLFERDLSVPAHVPQILAILMAGKPVEIQEAGLKITWTGPDRKVQFVGAEELKLTPPDRKSTALNSTLP